MNVLEHTEDLQRLLQEVQRVLKPGGVFAFHTINRSWCVCVCVCEREKDFLCGVCR